MNAPQRQVSKEGEAVGTRVTCNAGARKLTRHLAVRFREVACLLLLVTSCTPDAAQPTNAVTTSAQVTTTAELPTTESTDITGQPACAEDASFKGYEDQSPGPFFVCSVTSGPLITGGRVFERANIETAEEAIIEWANGPAAIELSLGYDGWNLARYEWFLPALSFTSDVDVLYMDLDHWEPINNLSTSYGSQVFITTLLGTVFSDSSVESFVLSILGDSCPQIGEGEICFR